MVAHNVISPDFVFGIFRRKDFAPSKVPEQRRFVGFIDVFDSNGIAGWVVDTVNPLMPVDIDIYLDEDLYTTLRCDIFRPDLLTAGYVDARKGFQARFEAGDNTVQQLRRGCLSMAPVS